MTTVGIVTGAGRGMGEACARRLADTVDVLLLVDRDAPSAEAVAADLDSGGGRAHAEPFAADITDRAALAGLAERVAELGTLRSVAHAAGISPTMADWRRIFQVDLIGTALLAEALRPLATAGTAHVYFSSMSPLLMGVDHPDPAVAEALDDPLREDFLDRIREAVGPEVEESNLAYPWAKYGVARFARKEAVRLGPVGARVCSLAPGIIDTPQGRQEAAKHPVMQQLVDATPLGRTGRSEEVADVVAFMLSDGASFLNGVDILVDGGVCAAVRDR
ncbi:SDR family oxidoreductase [Streptomyces fuscichromogenes]|uniref:Short-chain dehydrogenase/reductas n=1 Tax=Streptomyces fuscichromogenes TaxID=1324013 RepID=A0A917XPE4_9ACTN|nr:SDR family oxidoreductase [Streptomyces fuscichromogenes]GGN43958.1 short-chain dehydrogenase/reductas [Streptomyces fuscichromogenes]